MPSSTYKYKHFFLFAAFLLLLALSLHAGLLREMPNYRHLWAQADRFALSLNFVRNGLDLFHPATFNLGSVEGITGVEFPLQNYVVALLMKLTGSESPAIFRAYTLGVCLVGLLFLFALAQQVTRSWFKAAVAVLFVFTSPLFVYYQSNFLPSVHSFSLALIGYYFYYRYCKGQQVGQFYWAIFFFTLAAASRAPFAIILVASALQLGLYRRRYRTPLRQLLPAYLLSFGFIAAYFLYNEHLNHAYRARMFLTRPMPFESLAEAWATLQVVTERWGEAFLSRPQQLFLLIVVLLGLLCALRFGRRTARLLPRNDLAAHFMLLCLGIGLYLFLMGKQFVDHDYYLLDTLLLPVTFLVLWALGQIRLGPKWLQAAAAFCCLVFLVLFIQKAKEELAIRTKPDLTDRIQISRRNFLGADAFLDSLGIPRTAVAQVIDAYTPNVPLLLMKRRGHTLMATRRDAIIKALQQPADFIVVQDTFYLTDVVSEYPQITRQMTRLGGNGRISVYKKNASPRAAMQQYQFNFEPESPLRLLDNTATLSTEKAHSGRRSGKISEADMFSVTFKARAQELQLRPGQRVVAVAKVYADKPDPSLQLVLSLGDDQQAYVWKNVSAGGMAFPPGRWNTMAVEATLPEVRNGSDVLKVFVMKEGNFSAYVDDLEVSILEQ